MFAEYAALVIVFENLFGQGYQGGATWLETSLLALGALELPPTCIIWGATDDVLPQSLRDSSHVHPVTISQTDASGIYRLKDSIVRRVLRRPWESRAVTELALARDVDLWVGFCGFQGLGSQRPLIAWYPDFQFRHFPEYFDAGELRDRERQWDFLTMRADAIIVISQAVAQDAVATHAEIADKVHVCAFPPIFTLSDLKQDPDTIRQRYHLPERFFLVCNQFWQHKNHVLVLEALKYLKERGVAPPVVAFTGLAHDYRRPGMFSDLLCFVNEHGLHDFCRFLGVIPRDQQIALIRAATAVVHPSKFEGRGAIVEEAVLLGAQLLCSDLPVHRELHAPGALFFSPDGVEELAELLKRDYEISTKDEQTIANESQRLARVYGEQLMGVFKQVMERRQMV